MKSSTKNLAQITLKISCIKGAEPSYIMNHIFNNDTSKTLFYKPTLFGDFDGLIIIIIAVTLITIIPNFQQAFICARYSFWGLHY